MAERVYHFSAARPRDLFEFCRSLAAPCARLLKPNWTTEERAAELVVRSSHATRLQRGNRNGIYVFVNRRGWCATPDSARNSRSYRNVLRLRYFRGPAFFDMPRGRKWM